MLDIIKACDGPTKKGRVEILLKHPTEDMKRILLRPGDDTS